MKLDNLFQIIIPTFNEQDNINYILKHALDNNYLKHIIIVDDCSTDNTRFILEQWVKSCDLKVISLSKNCKKEGAILLAMSILKKEKKLKPYTLLLDADSMLIGDGSDISKLTQIENNIIYMKKNNYIAMALRIDVHLRHAPTLIEKCAFADYTAMQFDQWLVGHQDQLWVINGPGGIFKSKDLLNILNNIVPDFETGDFIITIDLMKQKSKICYNSKFSVDTLVPKNLKTYFLQRRRWERGTTKVLWYEKIFFLNLFRNFRLLALFTLIHFSVYIGIIASFVMILLGALSLFDIPYVLIGSSFIWFCITLIKGVILKTMRPELEFDKYFVYALINSLLWLFITTPSRLFGFAEGLIKILKIKNDPYFNADLCSYHWIDVKDNKGETIK